MGMHSHVRRDDKGHKAIRRSHLYAQAGNFQKALDVLPPPPLGKGNTNWADYRLTLKLLTKQPVDAYDLLACFPQHLTKFGKENVEEIAKQIDSLLDVWRCENESRYIEHLAGQINGRDWRTWDFAYLEPGRAIQKQVAVRTFCFYASKVFKEFAFEITRRAENAVRDEMGLSHVRTKKKRRPRKAIHPQVSLGGVVRENLPLPVVHYPNHYGTFFAFAEDEASPATLCNCSKPAIENLLELKKNFPPLRHDNPLREAPLDSRYFPDIIAELSLRHRRDPLSALCFEEALCHRCNLVTPTLRYCHEMYGSQFMQYYGWYVKQAYFRLGISPSPFGNYICLPDICPIEYQDDIRALEIAKMEYMSELQRLERIMEGPPRQDIRPDEITYWQNVKIEEAQPMVELRRRAAQIERAFTKKIENIARQEFGLKRVGEGWVSETMLFHIVERIFPNEEIIHHFHPNWLDRMELDVYVSSQKLGFEYQGQQHFHPVEIWGGKRGLEETKKRDKRKAALCKRAGVCLVTIDYTEPLTDEHVKARIAEDSQ